MPSWWPVETRCCHADLVAYRLVGASVCADRITDALEILASSAQAQGRDLAPALGEAGAAFCALKPDTALYVNAVRFLTSTAEDLTAAAVRERAEALRDHRRRAQAAIVRGVAAVLDDDGLVLVHDYSSAVARVLGELGRRGARDVVVTAGEPLGQGPRMAAVAVEAGHRVTYVPDTGVGRHAHRLGAFLTGVETFYRDGSMANTVGTLSLALLCRHAGAGVVAPAECLKMHPHAAQAHVADLSARLLHPWPPAGVRLPASCLVEDHVLDAVPATLVTTYVTELGPGQAAEVGDLAQGVLHHFSG